MLDSGADVRWVQHQLGHASIQQTVGTYSHIVPDKHEHTVRALDKLIR